MDKISALKKLQGLLEQGVITEEEFNNQKKLILEEKNVKERSDIGLIQGEEFAAETEIILSEEDTVQGVHPEEAPIPVNASKEKKQKGHGKTIKEWIETIKKIEISPTMLWGSVVGIVVVIGLIIGYSYWKRYKYESFIVSPYEPSQKVFDKGIKNSDDFYRVDALMMQRFEWFLDEKNYEGLNGIVAEKVKHNQVSQKSRSDLISYWKNMPNGWFMSVEHHPQKLSESTFKTKYYFRYENESGNEISRPYYFLLGKDEKGKWWIIGDGEDGLPRPTDGVDALHEITTEGVGPIKLGMQVSSIPKSIKWMYDHIEISEDEIFRTAVILFYDSENNLLFTASSNRNKVITGLDFRSGLFKFYFDERWRGVEDTGTYDMVSDTKLLYNTDFRGRFNYKNITLVIDHRLVIVELYLHGKGAMVEEVHPDY